MGKQISVQKARGEIGSRVKKAGPSHFGIVAVDCAKYRSKWMLADFYGRVLSEPDFVDHDRPAFRRVIRALEELRNKHKLRDMVVGVERTGRYHTPVQAAFRAAGLAVRTVHPYATSQFRQPSDPDEKTDDTDLQAIFRAVISGFALQDQALEGDWYELRQLVRHRRDLVQKRSQLYCQIHEQLASMLPGYQKCFSDFWKSRVALALTRELPSVKAFRSAGLEGLKEILRARGIRFQERSLTRVLAWATKACTIGDCGVFHRRALNSLDDDRRAKSDEIRALEAEIAHLLVQTPYVLLLSIPGINVVSAADFAGEMGPITHYANAKCITGRAGLYPRRYQSDKIDNPNRSLAKRCNRQLRTAIMMIAENLRVCNGYYRGLAGNWSSRDKKALEVNVRLATRFCRAAYVMVAGRKVFQHPGIRSRDCILEKLLEFHAEHGASTAQITQDLQAACTHVPEDERKIEAAPLIRQWERIKRRRRGPQSVTTLIPAVLATLVPEEVLNELGTGKNTDPQLSEKTRRELDNVVLC